MAISFDTIRQHLNQAGMKFSVDEDKNLAYFGVSTDDDELGSLSSPTFITLQEGGEYIQFRCYLDREKFPQEKTKTSPHLPALLQHLMYLNYSRKIGRWCFDPSDGDLYIDHGLPVEDNDKVTFRQFERLRGTLASSMFEAMPAIKRLIETGSAEKLDSAEIILAAMDLAVKQGKADLVVKLLPLKDNADQKTLSALQKALADKNIEAIAAALTDR